MERAAAILALTLAGCGDWTPMDCSREVQTSTITWVRVADPKATCEERGATTLDRGGACISCYEPYAGATSCVLYAESPAKMSDVILGHEVKHAFGCKHA